MNDGSQIVGGFSPGGSSEWLRGVRVAGVIAVAAAWANFAVAQNEWRSWSQFNAIDSEAFHVPVHMLSVASNRDLTMVVTTDGRLLAFGENFDAVAIPPAAPPGRTYTRVSASGVPVAELSDGSLVQWTEHIGGPWPPTAPPSLPAGVRWLEFASTTIRSFALRSDGTIVSWGSTGGGQEIVPVLVPGLSFVSVTTGQYFAAALVSDGTIRVWGAATYGGLLNPPVSPAGLGYTKVRAGTLHLTALRSDGQIVAWGDNTVGQCSVPSLPPGVVYVDLSAGAGHSVALRSDGQWVAWGSNTHGQCNLPNAPVGTYVAMQAGLQHTVALRFDGRLEAFGAYQTIPALSPAETYRDVDPTGKGGVALTSSGALAVLPPNPPSFPPAPALPPGVQYAQCSAGVNFWLGLGSDGVIRAMGGNNWGQLVVPALPPGVTYASIDCGAQNAVALRSDGTAVGWGDNSWGQTVIPPLPAGTTYVDASAGPQNVLLLRSDGAVVVAGTGGGMGLVNVPPPPAGLRYTDVACGMHLAAALCSDGSLVSWGSVSGGPSLPAGLSYVEVECGMRHAVARRSDGVVVSWGYAPVASTTVPPPAPGRSYLKIAANWESSAGLVGSPSTYYRVGSGCAGSLPAARLVPRDTPQIGRTLPVLLTHLPTSSAVMLFGWTQFRPGVPLSGLGMPGCTLHVSLDGAAILVGSNGEARFELAIPHDPLLIGVRFFNQALVFDPAAGNPFAAVMSEAMQGLVGG